MICVFREDFSFLRYCLKEISNSVKSKPWRRKSLPRSEAGGFSHGKSKKTPFLFPKSFTIDF